MAAPATNSPRPIDAALAFGVALAIVVAPAFFFADFEAGREHGASETWRALAAGRAVRDAPAEAASLGSAAARLPREALPGVSHVFVLTEGGLDEFDIERESALVACGPDGRPAAAPAGLEPRIREAAGKVKSARSESGTDGACADAGGGVRVCGVARPSGGVAGVVFRQTAPSVPAGWAGLAALAAVVIALLAFGRAGARAWWRLAAVGGAAAGAVASLLLAFAARSAVAAAAGLEQLLAGAGGALPSHDPAVGWGFVAAVTVAAGAAAGGLLRPVAAFFHDFRGRPFVYAAIAPAMVGMVLLIFVPFFMGVYLAFLDNDRNFVGLANFADILFPSGTSDTNFYFTLGVTVMWTSLNVFLHVAIGLALALVLSDAKLRGKAIYRVLLIVPWAVPNYITALVWKWIFNTQYGPANAMLALAGAGPVDWLGQSFLTNFAANLATNTWLGFPFMMIVSLGALQSIPADLYEAAQMDGAGRWQRFRHVTLPLLKPALFPAIILGTIWTFNMFNVVYLVSGGGPNNETNILITEAYRAFRVLKNYGLAAAYSLIIFFILAAYTAVTNRLTKAAESVYE
ncbi:MAG: sugar ABC transporter permease [Deltaproteobacteria bacterium]|nr:sugar ABC transporter permease [Deltaproteobacteria bacterium]